MSDTLQQQSASHVRTFAADLARAKGKPVPQEVLPPPKSEAAPDPALSDTRPAVTGIEPVKPVIASIPTPKEEEPLIVITEPLPNREVKAPAPSYPVLSDVPTLRPLPSEQAVAPLIEDDSVKQRIAEITARLETRGEAPPVLPKAPEEAPKAPAGPTVSPIKTYKLDVAEHAADLKASPLSLLAAEQDGRTPNLARARESTVKRPFPAALVAAGLVVLGIAALGVSWIFFESASTVDAPVTRAESPIAVDGEFRVAATAIPEAVVEARAAQVGRGEIRQIVLTRPGTDGVPMVLTVREVLDAYDAPGTLTRALSPNALIAWYGGRGGIEPLVVAPVVSYERSFKSMLVWEKDIASELAPLYGVLPKATSTATTTSITSWSDRIVLNTDARELIDVLGETHLIYGFPTKETLIIAKSIEAYGEALRRLAE